jgi:hypothetical protein
MGSVPTGSGVAAPLKMPRPENTGRFQPGHSGGPGRPRRGPDRARADLSQWVVWVAYGTRPTKCLIFSVIFVFLSSSSTGLQLRGATEAPALRAGVAAVSGGEHRQGLHRSAQFGRRLLDAVVIRVVAIDHGVASSG